MDESLEEGETPKCMTGLLVLQTGSKEAIVWCHGMAACHRAKQM